MLAVIDVVLVLSIMECATSALFRIDRKGDLEQGPAADVDPKAALGSCQA